MKSNHRVMIIAWIFITNLNYINRMKTTFYYENHNILKINEYVKFNFI